MTAAAPWNDTASIASHTDPSATSESPSSTHTRPSVPSRRIASAMPSPTARPWPSEPVATSIHGISGIGAGWPCSGEPSFRSESSSASPNAPIAFSVA